MYEDQRFDMIVACDMNWAIGYKNELLTKLPEDMKFFKKMTTGQRVIMGNNTCKSIPYPLPNRTNIILSKSLKSGTYNGFIIVNSIEELQELIETLDDENSNQQNIVIGGASVYKQFLDKDLIDRAFLTTINHRFPSYDAYIPNLYDYGFKMRRLNELHVDTGYEKWTKSSRTYIDLDNRERHYYFNIKTLIKKR